ncbi:MAG: hypothetical protein UMV23_01160 [Halanaerobium sp.]|nr:hypothetical protein [Halanaerobium sp.]
MKKNRVSTLKVAATYIGTIVGAGFATGQEVLQFFSRFGIWGFPGLLITTGMFMIFGYIIMSLGKELNARSHLEIIIYSGGRVVGKMIDYIITFFLFGALTAMIAGTGALFSQEFNLPGFLGNIIMAALTAGTVLTGIKGVINSISFVVPFLLVSVVGVSIFSIINTPPDINAVITGVGENELISNWLLAATLYVSYNTIISIAVLGPLGVQAYNERTIRDGALLGGLGLGIGSMMIYLALSGNIREIVQLEVPMIYIAGLLSSLVQTVYAIVLTAEVYTTAVGSLYGFVSRIVDTEKAPAKGKILIIGSTIAALLASQLGFSNLVKYLYPLVGYGGIVLLISLIYTSFSRKELFK